jgi:cobyrinic acid a,c-diamide synthase
MTARALLVSAIASGEGKTTVTAALARHLMQRGRRVRVFKTGADFLDASMLERATGQPVYVLDTWMVGEEECRALLAQALAEADIVLVEGVMGLYDGTPSSADLSRLLDLPVVAVIDARAMAQTAGAVALGLRDFGPVRLAGVIANGVAGAGHRAMLAGSLRDIPLIATLPRQPRSLPERHLGLTLPGESRDVEELLDRLGKTIEVDEAAFRTIADGHEATARQGATKHAARQSAAHAHAQTQTQTLTQARERPLAGRHIAVARDAAFAFLYPANIDCLARLGADISFFSPLADEPVPDGAGGVFLPGGYPELHAERLSHASRFRDSIRAAHGARVPILAECGGMMSIAESVGGPDGRDWPMVGLLPGCARLQTRLAALGPQSWATRSGELRGHTFHYSTLDTPLAAVARTRTHPYEAPGEPIYRVGTLTASYFHAYFNSCPGAIAALFSGEDP